MRNIPPHLIKKCWELYRFHSEGNGVEPDELHDKRCARGLRWRNCKNSSFARQHISPQTFPTVHMKGSRS
jgi:hypothetical protein